MKYPLFKVHIDKETALAAIGEVFESSFINEGVQVSKLTEAMKKRFDTENLILVNSCTSAITMALKLAGIKQGDQVISTPMTCVASNCPITTMDANILWADVDPNTGCVSSESVAACFRTNPKIKAVIVVAWAGNPPDMRGLRDICDEYGAKLILDAAHAFDARYNGKQIYELADFTCYSFQAIKHFTTGDGGMLICKSINDYERSKKMKWFGIDRDAAKDSNGNWKGQHWDFDISETGYKFNMNNVAAAIGLSQLDHIDNILSRHRNNGDTYNTLLITSKYVEPLQVSRGLDRWSLDSSYWVYTLLLKKPYGHIRDEVLKRLNAEGIGAGLVHVPNDDYSCFKDIKRDLPGVRTFSERQISLPVGWWLDNNDIDFIVKRFHEICDELTII
jgi:perosamine synthetase